MGGDIFLTEIILVGCDSRICSEVWNKIFIMFIRSCYFVTILYLFVEILSASLMFLRVLTEGAKNYKLFISEKFSL